MQQTARPVLALCVCGVCSKLGDTCRGEEVEEHGWHGSVRAGMVE
jgi:hypothetical protein